MTNVLHTLEREPLDIEPLRARVAGSVSVPGDADWDEARQAWNLAVDQRPAAVVQAGERRRRRRRRRVRPRPRAAGRRAGHRPQRGRARLARGHDPGQDAPHARRRDRRRSRGSPASRPACSGSRSPAAAAEHGLAALAGSSPDVGVVGYTLGGGLSWLGRKHGLAANSVTAIELVTADGRMRPRDGRGRPRAVLGAARRRRQLRPRHRDRVRALPDRRGLRRRAASSRSSARARCCTRGGSGSRRCRRRSRRSAGSCSSRRFPTCPRSLRGTPFAVVDGDRDRRRGRGRRAASAAARARARDGHVRDPARPDTAAAAHGSRAPRARQRPTECCSAS